MHNVGYQDLGMGGTVSKLLGFAEYLTREGAFNAAKDAKGVSPVSARNVYVYLCCHPDHHSQIRANKDGWSMREIRVHPDHSSRHAIADGTLMSPSQVHLVVPWLAETGLIRDARELTLLPWSPFNYRPRSFLPSDNHDANDDTSHD
jgi:hypothetical protein